MELATSIKVKASALFTFSLLLFTSSVFADVAIVAPKGGATVSLLKPEQRAYLAQPKDARWAQMADATARERYAKCGGRPASVKLEWKDDQFTSDTVYTIELTKVGTEKTTSVQQQGVERFTVRGAQSADLVNLEAGRLYQWRVADKVASFMTAEEPRLVFIPGVPNCRDLGGKVGTGGKRIQQGRVFRTAAYNGSSKRVGDSFLDARFVPGAVRITKSGRRELVETCGVKTDIDLRNEAECAEMKASPLGERVAWVHVPIRAYGWLENDKVALGKILKVFADEKNYPIAFHCAGGRDRAGSLAFVLEGLCGVTEDELLKDWEFSLFETSDIGFAPTRIEGLLDMLKNYKGETTNARIESFVKACGVSDAEILKIRANLMEK